MKKLILLILLFSITLIIGSCGSGNDTEDPKAYVRITNQTGYVFSDISAGGTTWTGSYYDGETTEQKEVPTGDVYITWYCNGSQSMHTNIEPGYWRITLYDCAAVSVIVDED